MGIFNKNDSYEATKILLDENKKEDQKVKEYLTAKVIQYLKALDLLMVPNTIEEIQKAYDKAHKKEEEKPYLNMGHIYLIEEAKTMLERVIETKDDPKFKFLFYITSR